MKFTNLEILKSANEFVIFHLKCIILVQKLEGNFRIVVIETIRSANLDDESIRIDDQIKTS